MRSVKMPQYFDSSSLCRNCGNTMDEGIEGQEKMGMDSAWN